MTASHIIALHLGEMVFQFRDKQSWINAGPEIWRRNSISNNSGICIDAKGRICERGEHFSRAETDGSYPISVYRKQPE